MKYAIWRKKYQILRKLGAPAERDDDDSDESESDDEDNDESESDNKAENTENDQNNKGIFLKSAFEIENNLPCLFGKRMKERR